MLIIEILIAEQIISSADTKVKRYGSSLARKAN
jgi:hypothetical protein